MAALTRICERLDDVAVSYFQVLKELEDIRRKYAVNASEVGPIIIIIYLHEHESRRDEVIVVLVFLYI